MYPCAERSLHGSMCKAKFHGFFTCAEQSLQRGWSLWEIMEQAGAGFHKPEQQQRLVLPVEAGQDDYIKEICSPEGFIFNPARF